ncbi:MAG TPA: FtsQ-type POTRA domain-containing protein [Clostridiaceae bacterium]|nr:FtsQ-type POTRA domain-containing protein [Clostridiaceae bacterium]
MMCLVLLFLLFFLLPVFHIQTIEIKNADFIAPEKLIQSAGINQNQHFLQGMGGTLSDFFNGRYKKAEQQVIRDIPQVADITISYSFPNKIVFDVKERIAIGWVKIPDGFCTIDGQGVVVEILDQEPQNLPIIEGITITNLALGKRVEVEQREYLENAMFAMSALIEADLDFGGEKLLYHIDVIEPTINNNIYLRLNIEDQELLIICDNSRELKSNFMWLKQVLNTKVIADKGSGMIDLRGKTRTFKPDTNTNGGKE